MGRLRDVVQHSPLTLDVSPRQTCIDLEQLSPEWFNARKSRLTASRIAAALGCSPFKTRRELWHEHVAQRPKREYSPKGLAIMQHGTDTEPYALECLQSHFPDLQMWRNVGMWLHTGMEGGACIGGSPDAVAYVDGVHLAVEVKCPVSMYSEPKLSHLIQMQVQMLCMNVSQALYVCFHEGYPTADGDSLRVWMVDRDDDFIDWMVWQVRYFLSMSAADMEAESNRFMSRELASFLGVTEKREMTKKTLHPLLQRYFSTNLIYGHPATRGNEQRYERIR